MALVAITTVPVAVTVMGGDLVSVSAACTLGRSSAGAASGPSVNGSFTWPGTQGVPNTLFVQTAATANLNYIS